MRNNIFKRLLHAGLLIAISTAFLACEKPEGEGGKASIRGSIWLEDWNSTFTVLQADYAAADVDVFIIYGDNVSYGDKTSTNYNGEYEFKFLREGNYKVYVYSKDKTMKSASGDTVFVQNIKISKKKETVFAEKMTIYK